MKENRNLAKCGLILMLAALAFAFFETWYFGFNMLPKSKEEIVCDAAAMVLCGIGSLMFICAIVFQAGDEIVKIFKENKNI